MTRMGEWREFFFSYSFHSFIRAIRVFLHSFHSFIRAIRDFLPTENCLL
jgi:hypothetical protein